jgi:quinol monooxygenase YgiN
MSDDVDVALVTMVFDAAKADELLSCLAKYVVLARGEGGCRNIDLTNSLSDTNRFVIVQKWQSEDAARAHFDSPVMVDMARECAGLLAKPPAIDLLQGLSAHDLK